LFQFIVDDDYDYTGYPSITPDSVSDTNTRIQH